MSANIVSIDRLLRRCRVWSAQELAEARTDGDHKATDDKVNDGRATTIRFAGSKGPENANAAAMLNAAGHAAVGDHHRDSGDIGRARAGPQSGRARRSAS
jgi:hypothetical protein